MEPKTDIIFFLDTAQNISESRLSMVYTASYLAEETDNQVYFINNEISNLPKDSVSDKLHVMRIDDFAFDEHRYATYVTATNYLFYLLAHIASYKQAKILVLNDFPEAYKALQNQMPSELKRTDSILQLLCEHSACLFANANCIDRADQFIEQDHLMRYFTVIGDYCLRDEPSEYTLKSKKRICVAWYNPIADHTFYPLQCLLRNLKSVFPDMKIDVHIMGDGKKKWSIDYSEFSPRIRFFFSPLYDDTMATLEYMRENVDIVFTNGISAVRSASIGLPTVLVPTTKRQYKDNQYVFFCDTTGGRLSWSPNELWSLEMKTYTLLGVLEKILIENKKQEIGNNCYRQYISQFSAKQNAGLLLDQIKKNDLTVERCCAHTDIQRHLMAFFAAKNDYKVSNYQQYHDFIREQNKRTNLKNQLKNNIKSGKLYIKQETQALNKIKKYIPNPNYYKIQLEYKNKVKRISEKAIINGSINVAFILVFNSVFPTRPVFEAMLKTEHFNPFILVVPNVSRDHEYQMRIYREAVDSLTMQYPGHVIGAYNETYDEYLELKDEYQLIFFCNPYPKLVNPYHSLDYFLKRDVLTIYMNYGFAALSFWNEVISSDFYNKIWLACVESKMNLEYLKHHEPIKGLNGIVTGYLKMDKMASIVAKSRNRKRILICPHHTVWGWSTLNIGNFLVYHNLFLELPKLYPNVDFVFRPHPLLFENLLVRKIWSQQQINDYIEKMESYENAVYDTTGDYLEVFVNSDAMIHDCGSFIGEYLYTEKPCCYMLKDLNQVYEGFVPLGQKCIEQHYKAFNKKDILDFIDKVVIKGDDPMKKRREQFVREELKVNYPHAADEFIKVLEKVIFKI